MILKITKRIFLVIACFATYNAHGAVVPGKQVSLAPLAQAGLGLVVASCIGMYNRDKLVETFQDLLSPAPVPNNMPNERIFIDTENNRVLRREALVPAFAGDLWNYSQTVGGVLALNASVNAIRGVPFWENSRPILNTAGAYGSSFMFFKYLPRFFRNYVTNIETYSLSGTLLITVGYLILKSRTLARGGDVLSV